MPSSCPSCQNLVTESDHHATGRRPRQRTHRIGGHQRREDTEELLALRPRTLDEYDVGQERLIDNLKIAIGAARQRGDVLEHMLFDGPPGLGKTTLAHIIANEMGADLHRTSGPVARARDATSSAC